MPVGFAPMARQMEYMMTKTLALLASTIAVAAFATPAAAQNAPEGARAELQLGWDRLTTSDDFASLESDGLVYGIGGGYDFKVGNNISLGIDAEITDSSIEESEQGRIDGISYDVTAELGRDLYAGARVNFGIGENAVAYLKAGVTNVQADFTITTFDAVTFITEEFSDDDTGWRAGAGLQFGVASNAYVGGEYRWADYENDFQKSQIVGTIGYQF